MSIAGLVAQGWNPSSVAPAYMGGALQYIPSRNVANIKTGPTGNILKTRAALQRAASGGRGDYVIIGDSAASQYEVAGNHNSPQLSFVAQLQKFLVQNGAGIVDGGDGALPSSMGQSIPTDGWTNTGAFSNAAFPYMSGNGVGTTTRVTQKACTDLYIVVHGQSAAWTYNIDGAGAIAGNPSTLPQWDVVHVGGLANAIHTVVITSTALCSYAGIRAEILTGLHTHNLGMAGARANSGSSVFNWSDFSAITNMAPARLALLPATVDATFVEVGANDIPNGVNPVTAAAGIANIMSHAPLTGSDLWIICTWHVAGVTDAAWNAFLAACCSYAALAGAVVVDWNDRVGGQAVANTNGYLQSDATHPTDATSAGFGKAIGDLLLD